MTEWIWPKFGEHNQKICNYEHLHFCGDGLTSRWWGWSVPRSGSCWCWSDISKYFGHVGRCKFVGHVQLLRLIFVKNFWSNSNQKLVIFIWSCELASTISLLLIAFFIYNILVIMTWWCAMKNIILDIPFVVFTKMCLDGC